MDHPDGIKIPRTISYSSELGSTIEPLRINNASNNTYVFKIRTNQKTTISLHSTHGFFRPKSTLEVPIKIIQKPNPTVPLKLEVNYAIATAEDIEGNDSKKAIIGKNILDKKVIILRESNKKNSDIDNGSQKGNDGNSERNVFNNEDDFLLDSSIKKQESQSCFNTVQVTPFKPTKNIIRAPKSFSELSQTEPQSKNTEEIPIPQSMFKHTFSIEKQIQELPLVQPNSPEQQVKMNIFQNILTKDNQRKDSPPKEDFNPFQLLFNASKKQSQREASPVKEEPKYEFSIRENKEEKVEAAPSSVSESPITKKPLIESRMIEDEKAQQRQLFQLKIRIQCEESYIRELQWLPTPQQAKKYPKWLFVLSLFLFFALGGLTRHFAL